MALHTHQEHPHVHLVIKAEREDGQGRLRIDKARLRRWREDFAQAMRLQGIEANATPRAWRGQKKRATLDKAYWAERDGRSTARASRLRQMLAELQETGAYRNEDRTKLTESRKATLAGWESVAKALDRQGQAGLADEVRHFARQLPGVLTDREWLAKELKKHAHDAHLQRRPDKRELEREIGRMR